MTESPFTFAEARRAAHHASNRQIEKERDRIDAATALAECERAYRMALAKRMTILKAEGAAWTAAADLARGDAEVADLKYRRDVAAGVLAAAEQAGFRLQADRRVLEQLVRWSQARELAEGGA